MFHRSIGARKANASDATDLDLETGRGMPRVGVTRGKEIAKPKRHENGRLHGFPCEIHVSGLVKTETPRSIL